MAKLVSGTYGEALFETAIEENEKGGSKVDELFEEVLALKDILLNNPDLSLLMNHPRLLKEQKAELMEDIFGNRLSKELMGFLKIVIDNGRYGDIIPILDHFADRVREYKGIGVARVSTPMELSEARKEEIRKKLLETTGYTSMDIEYDIDESLIGGIVIRIGDRVVDSSIKTKLATLKKELAAIQLK